LQKNFANREESQAAQNYSFRVEGTNRTLKQAVVFSGNLVANGNLMANGQQKFDRNFGGAGGGGAGGAQQQAALTNQLPWSNSRIAGTAIVGKTNNIEVNAVSQSP
jgi:hypothetical protein